MTNTLLRIARQQQGWSQQQLADFAGVSLSTIERAERGESIRIDNLERICTSLEKTPEQLGMIKTTMKRRDVNKALVGFVGSSLLPSTKPAIQLWNDDLLAVYARGIAACQDLYYNGNPTQVEAILPLYTQQTALFAEQSGLLQPQAAQLASLASQLSCELATDREDFGTAQHIGQQALFYAQLANNRNLQVNALISLANIGWHLSSAQPLFLKKHSKSALQAYEHAASLLDKNVTPLLKGRTYVGLAEVYALRGQVQETMRAMNMAYEHFPMEPEKDPMYQHVRASRYSLHVFGGAQSWLFLEKPDRANEALIVMQQESKDINAEPITKVDFLYYQAEVQIQQGELEQSIATLASAATLAKKLGSRLYLNKLSASYHKLEEKWPKEHLILASKDLFY